MVSLAATRSDGVEMEVAYVLPAKTHLVSDLQEVGATVHLLSGRWGLADPRWPLRLLRLVRRRRPDVVHVHSPAVAAIARPVLTCLPGRPVVVSTEHNVWSSFGWATRLANGITLPLTDAALAVSDEVVASAWPRLRTDLEVVVQGIPVDALDEYRSRRGESRRELSVEPEDVVVVMLANFREKKDYPTYLRAAAACADHPHLRFFSIGQGPLEEKVHALHRQLGLGDRFAFLGYHPDPPALLAGADLFTLTSRHEGLPIALLEAMALAVPPVASAVGGIPEVVTDGVDGVLLPPGDVAAFAGTFRRLADEPATRAELAARAQRRARDFDIAQTQRVLEARYRELLAATAGRSPAPLGLMAHAPLRDSR